MSVEDKIYYTDWEIDQAKKVLVYFNQQVEKTSEDIKKYDTIIEDQKRQLGIYEKERELLVKERRLHEIK